MIKSNSILRDVKGIIAQFKHNAIRRIDFERTMMYWHIGKRIFTEEQAGKKRAGYGDYLIQYLSDRLQPKFGSGFSVRQLQWYRQFYRTFPIASTLWTQLSWSQYKLLLGCSNNDERNFYIAETLHNNWTVRQLERQINSSLFQRLLLSNDKESVLAVARKEKLPYNAKEIIKDPIVLEFLDLKQKAAYYEKDLEAAIIENLQDFLLELGNGFSFVARQKRINIDGDEFFIDLVFYNRLLQCFVLIEIKTQKLTHQDIGQLQMYVNYYDRKEKLIHEKPTIGIMLCASKNDSVVKFTLPEGKQQIVASQYKLYLPSEKQLLKAIQQKITTYPKKPTSGSAKSPQHTRLSKR